MARKTIPVADLVDRVNTRLATPDSTLRLADLTPEQAFRLGMASLLDSVLHETGNYKGFGYQVSELVEGQLRPGYDDTRRRYTGGTA